MPEATTLLAFDYGARRIGVAVGQTVTGSARELATLTAVGDEPDWDAIESLIDDWQPDLLLVGLPLDADGGESAQCEAVRAFATELAHAGLPVQLIDEHLSSREAEARLAEARSSGRRRRRVAKGDVDALSAVIIAEQWLADRDLGRPRPGGARIRGARATPDGSAPDAPAPSREARTGPILDTDDDATGNPTG